MLTRRKSVSNFGAGEKKPGGGSGGVATSAATTASIRQCRAALDAALAGLAGHTAVRVEAQREYTGGPAVEFELSPGAEHVTKHIADVLQAKLGYEYNLRLADSHFDPHLGKCRPVAIVQVFLPVPGMRGNGSIMLRIVLYALGIALAVLVLSLYMRRMKHSGDGGGGSGGGGDRAHHLLHTAPLPTPPPPPTPALPTVPADATTLPPPPPRGTKGGGGGGEHGTGRHW